MLFFALPLDSIRALRYARGNCFVPHKATGFHPWNLSQLVLSFGGPMAKHILVVDSEAALLPMISMSLRKSGFCVWQAHHPLSALQMAANGIPAMDVLLTDILMPRFTGAQLSDRLREFFPYMGTVYMTGLGKTQLANLGLDLPEWQLILKPFRSEEMVAKVRAAVTAASDTTEIEMPKKARRHPNTSAALLAS
jgi:DNA-binding response OmpR family regulator